jgi:glycosyltransferase involved in cell wall biosynthesis
MAEPPSISIIIPLHNKGPFINETLESVVAQDWTNWECLVVENGSSDDGPGCAERWTTLDQRIRLLVAPASVAGPGGARNLGLNDAKGDWILFLDADDLLAKDYLSSMLRRAEEVPGAVIVASRWIERPSAPAEPEESVVKEPIGWRTGGTGLEDGAIAFTCWAVHAAIVKRTWLRDRTWPEELDRFLAEDTAFWFRVVHGARVAYSDTTGAVYRTQTDNCRTNLQASAWFEGSHEAVRSNLGFLRARGAVPSGAQIESLIQLYSGLYEHAVRAKDRDTARRALAEATFWLRERFEKGSPVSRSMKVRRLLGIRSYQFLKRAHHAILPS